MNILFINTGPWGTGSFTAIKGLSKQLLEEGHKVKILFPDAHLESEDMDEYYNHPELYHVWQFPISNNDITLKTFPLMLTDPHPRSPNPILFKDMTAKEIAFYNSELHKELKQLINAFKPTIIECHHIWYTSWLLSQMGLDYLLTAHHSDQMGFRENEKIRPYALEGAKHAKVIFAISESVKQEVMHLYHVPKSKILISENGYDKDIFKKQITNKKALLKEFGIEIEADATIVNCVGKLSFNKGIDIILQANKLLNKNLNIHFIIIGAGAINPLIESLLPGSFSLDKVHLIGHQNPSRIAQFHNISKLSLMPSRSEGFGIACLEAMACGVPTIVSQSGGPETFAVGKIMDHNTPQQLAHAITNLINLPDKAYRELSDKAVFVAQQFSWSNILPIHMRAYEQILSEKN